jgi:CelD/BcsL family acetyltransferase involved in cellulose biosynthesis
MTPRRLEAGPLRGRVVAPHQLRVDERALWCELCSAPGLAHPFYSLAFAECVARVHPHVRVCVLERGQTVEGFLPFQFAGVWERTAGAAEPVGGSMSDCFGVIARPTARFSPAELLAAAGIHAMLFHHLVEDQLSFSLSGEQPRPRHRIVISDDPADYWRRLKAANKSFVAEIERRQRRVVDAFGPLRFEFAVGDPADRLKRLISHKREQYRTTNVPDALAPTWKRALLLELASRGDPECSGILSELHAGNTWVASHFGLRNQHTLHYWFPIYNSALARLAPGHLLVRQIIDEGPAHGIRVIDRGEGDQPHKTAWLTEQSTLYRGLWSRPGLRSLAYRVHLAISWRVKTWTRHSAGKLGRTKE